MIAKTRDTRERGFLRHLRPSADWEYYWASDQVEYDTDVLFPVRRMLSELASPHAEICTSE